MNNRKHSTFDFVKPCAEKFPAQHAIISGEKKLTYAELLDIVRKKAAYYNTIFEQNEPVTIFARNSGEFISSVLALWKINALPVPLNTMLSEKQIRDEIEITGAKKLLTEAEHSGKIFGAETFLIDKTPDAETEFSDKSFDARSAALVLFTSGTTAEPKAVKFTFENLLENAKNISEYFNGNENDSWLASLPFYHIGGFAIIYRALFSCAPVIVPASLSFAEQKKSIAEFRPAFFSVVQTTLERLLNEEVNPYKELKAVFAGGGPISARTMRNAIAKGFPVHKVYGSTETTSMITILSPVDFKTKAESAGKPFASVNIELASDGEIIVSGKQITEGYFNNYEQTKKRYENGKFPTGDVGEIDEDGFLFITGRKTDFIISGGENINLQKVKKALLELAEINDAEAFAVPDKIWGEKLCAAVVIEKKITEKEIKTVLEKTLAKYEIPKKIYFTEEIPRNELGKVKADALDKITGSENGKND